MAGAEEDFDEASFFQSLTTRSPFPAQPAKAANKQATAKKPQKADALIDEPAELTLDLPAVAAATDTPPEDNAPAAEVPLYHGHRDRVRKRFDKIGGEAFEDYELLEIALFGVIPRGDTKDTAKRLLKRFGTFAEVVGAPKHLLQEVEGIGPNAATDIKVLAAVAQRIARGAVIQREALTSWNLILEYLRTAMAFDAVEKFRVLYLNKKNLLIADEVQQEGIVDHTPAYPSKVVNRAYNLGATAIVLVHNHPSGDPEPSRADIDLTKAIIAAAKNHNIVVHDHIIIGRNGHASLRGQGYI
ncbi:DNA repair protein RadC [Tianweitania sp. BSSL-BM11]|uniref:DNA repair protein RadC n=1 Tax=Tianweitania aestuarii TaxID=2814886 RepID=A0ABS5RUC6_9HYPH|nr:DNA repair protein RadC [Tianweitania aestuarii]